VEMVNFAPVSVIGTVPVAGVKISALSPVIA
jgi:hypothetical protein